MYKNCIALLACANLMIFFGLVKNKVKRGKMNKDVYLRTLSLGITETDTMSVLVKGTGWESR